MPGDDLVLSATDPVRRAIAEQVDQWPATEDAVRADADDAVHQMRVSIRRIRSLLRAAHSDDTGLDEDLQWLARVLGTARDAEVLAQRYRDALDRLPAELVRGPVFERLVDAAVARYQAGWAQAVAAMDSPRYRQLLTRLHVVGSAGQAWGSGAPQNITGTTVDAAYRRLRKAARAAPVAGAGRDAELHRIRKAAKRLRYTAAALDAPLVAERARTIQTLLGEHQDSVVAREHLLSVVRAADAAGEDTFTYGLLYQQEGDVARGCRVQLDEALDELDAAMAAMPRV